MGLKWHDFLMTLEQYYGLKHDNPDHIWLVHYLFLDAINEDAQDWVQSWNSHVMQIKGETNRSPVDMFAFGILKYGPRGLEFIEEEEDEQIPSEELASYGVDFEAQANPRLMDHLLRNNEADWEEGNPFLFDPVPQNRPYVECEPPGCSLSAAALALFNDRLRSRVDVHSRDMEVRKLIWQEALAICGQVYHL
jgi:hypothetical protein